MASSSTPNRYPPKNVPEDTVWFGGPVDEAKVTLRIYGEKLDPEKITQLLGCPPSQSARTGETITSGSGVSRIVTEGFWRLSNGRSATDIEDQVSILLAQLTKNLEVWHELTSQFQVDLFCGLFLNATNRGFGLNPSLIHQLSERGISIGFDIYAPETLSDDHP